MKEYEFRVAQFNPTTCAHTGVVETYYATSPEVAVQRVLYTRRLADGRARVGPTGRVVYGGGFGYTVIRAK